MQVADILAQNYLRTTLTATTLLEQDKVQYFEATPTQIKKKTT